MNDSLKHKIFTETDCISEQTMFDYIDKKLSARESHSVEKHLLHCELCSDALEGLEHATNSRERIATINQKIREYIAEPKKETGIISFNYKLIVSIAASVLLLIGGVFFFNQFSKKDGMAEFKSEKNIPFPPPPAPPLDGKMLSDSTISSSSSSSIEVAKESNAIETKVKSPLDKMEEIEQQAAAEGQGSSNDLKTSSTNGEKVAGNTSAAYNPIIQTEENKKGISPAPVKADNSAPKSAVYEGAKDGSFAEMENEDQVGGAVEEKSVELSKSTVARAKSASAPGTDNRDDNASDKVAKKSERTNNLFRSEALEKRKAEKDIEESPTESIAYAPQNIAVGDETIELTKVAESEPDQLQDQDAAKSIDQLPEFQGGQDSLLKFINKNFKYPSNYKNESISNKKIYVNFVVDEKGGIKKAKIQKGINPELDKEALRVVNSMPKWKAGTKNGKPVSVNFNLPISLE
ncbi:MAG: energy transducer TonB [Bacteroidota bacterium]